VKFDSAGARQWATYYGGTGDELFMFSSDMGLATDAGGNLYLTGATSSTTGIASGGFQNTYGGGSQDAFLVKFDAAGNRMWATYYGDADEDKAYSVALDDVGNIFMAGRTTSASNIAASGFQNTYGAGQDAFLVKFNREGERLCATYYGMSDWDDCNSVAVDGQGYVYVAGGSANASGIAVGGHQTFFGGGSSDAMLIKFTSICGTTEVEKVVEVYAVEMFPNPAAGYLIIKSAAIISQVDILNALGEVVCSVSGKTVDIHSLAAGLFYVRVALQTGEIVVKKLIIEG
jgi:hypothetical protein